MRVSFPPLGVLPLLLTACVGMRSMAPTDAFCDVQGGVGATYNSTAVSVDAGHVQVNTRFQLSASPDRSVDMDFIYLVNGKWD